MRPSANRGEDSVRLGSGLDQTILPSLARSAATRPSLEPLRTRIVTKMRPFA